jgi:hypothetical protein
MAFKIKNIKKTYISKEIEYCCKDMEKAVKNFVIHSLIKNDTNEIEVYIGESSDSIKYCPFCGEKLQDE